MDKPINVKSSLGATNIIFLVLLVFFVALVVATGVGVYSQVKSFFASGGPLASALPAFVAGPTSTTEFPGEIALPVATDSAPLTVGPVPEPWDGAERVTVLLVGLDYRDWERGEGPPRTDTMILLTLDPLAQTAGMLNIPRDLWVNIPGGFGSARINTAYPLGEAWQYMGGGPGLAIDTVEQLLGIEINYFAQIDFAAFENFINEIGGVEIDVPEEIKVDPIGPHNTVVLQPGRQTLDGAVALAYARARYTEGGDFDRARRQQQVIYAIRSRILQVNMLPTLMARGQKLYEELAGGVHTNMSLEEAFSLAWLAQGIPLENINEGVIAPPDHVILMKSPDGSQDILKPVMGNIYQLRDQIFAATAPVVPGFSDTSVQELMQLEGARVVLMNGSSVPGLGTRTQEYLVSQGATIVETSDAPEFYYYTTIVDYTGNPYTVRYLRGLMNIESNYRRLQYNPASQTDIILYLGSDWANGNPMP